MASGVVLVGNKTAQSGRAEALIARASDALNARGVAHRVLDTEPDGGTVGVVRRAIENDDARCVIYMGGDGTFAEVAKGILASNRADSVTMGMLPTGTANDQGKSFGLASGGSAIERNIDVIVAGQTTAMDVGRVEVIGEDESVIASDLFFDTMSVGLGAAVLATRNRDREVVGKIPVVRALYRDQLVYAGALLKRFAASAAGRTTFNLSAVIDGKEHEYESVIDVIITNTRVYGGEWVLAPEAASDDGLFEMIPIAGRRDFTSKILTTLRHSPIDEPMLAKLGLRHSEPVAGARFELTVLAPWAVDPPPAQIDGEELIAADKFRIEVLPRILTLIVPATLEQ